MSFSPYITACVGFQLFVLFQFTGLRAEPMIWLLDGFFSILVGHLTANKQQQKKKSDYVYYWF